MKGLGNDNEIAYIQINKQKIAKNVQYFDEKVNFLGKITRKEGFYNVTDVGYFGEFPELIDKIPSNLLINNKTAFYKANIIIEFSNSRRETIYFNTDDDMEIYLKREFQGKNWRVFS